MSFTNIYDKDIKEATELYLPYSFDWLYLKAQYIAESGLDCDAVSPVGACGIAQFMPATWAETRKKMKLPAGNPHNPKDAIPTGAFYLNSLIQQWNPNTRTIQDRRRLAWASYNAGLGNLIKAQKKAGGAADYASIIKALPLVTGKANAKQTSDYIKHIEGFYSKLSD